MSGSTESSTLRAVTSAFSICSCSLISLEYLEASEEVRVRLLKEPGMIAGKGRGKGGTERPGQGDLGEDRAGVVK